MDDYIEELAEAAPKAEQPARPAIPSQRQTAPDFAAAFSMVLGASVLVGWTLGLTEFNSVFRGLVAMQPVTALSFVASGAALLLANRRSRPAFAQGILAIFVLVLGLVSLAQYLAQTDLGTDRLLFRQAVMAQPVAMAHPGRMAEATAISFTLIAICLLLARTRNPLLTRIYSASATIVLVFVVATLLGYLFVHGPLTTIFGLSHVALNTAIGLAVLSIGLLVLRSDAGWVRLLAGERVGASAARRLLPLVISVPIIVAWLAFQGSEAGLYAPEVRLALTTTVTLGLLVALTIWAATRLNSLDTIRRTEQSLRDTQRRLEAVLNNASVAIFTMDQRHHCSYMNLAAETMTGYSFAETQGRPLHDVVHHTRPDGSHFPLEECPIDRAFPQNNQQKGEETFVHRDGSFYRVSFTASPLRDERGEAVGTIIEARNIEKEKAAQEQLRHVQRLDAIGQLTGGVAHDFNNILAIIVGNLDLLRPELDDNSEASELADEAIDAATRGAELVRRLLAYARKQHLEPAAIDLNERLPMIIALLRRSLGETIEIRVESAGDLWPAMVDATQVDDALVNLAINARDAMPHGGTLTIQTSNAHLDEDYAASESEVVPGDYVSLTVTDTGGGMPQEVVARAFEPFFSTKEEGKGTGLGLSQVYGWVKQSGGHVKIYSEVGHGTTIRVYLPRAAGAAATDQVTDDSIIPGGKETILVVEDNADVRRTILRQLADLGYSTLHAQDGATALEMVRHGANFDLLLTDVVMPGGMTGFELAERTRILRPDLKVIFSSGYADISAAGGHPTKHGRLLSKPYRKQELARAIRAELDAG